MRKLTINRLREAGACSSAKADFRRLFPKGTYLSPKDRLRIYKWAEKHYYTSTVIDYFTWAKWNMLSAKQRNSQKLWDHTFLDGLMNDFVKAWNSPK